MPMAPTLVRKPFHRDGWVYEEKVDGWRMLAYKDGERVRWLATMPAEHNEEIFCGLLGHSRDELGRWREEGVA
jgi:hypothetical protein